MIAALHRAPERTRSRAARKPHHCRHARVSGGEDARAVLRGDPARHRRQRAARRRRQRRRDARGRAKELGIVTHRHPRNLGYGANQKTCYRAALADGADIVVMLHPDYQYEPKLITAMAAMIASQVYDVVIGSRILGNTALRGGMPLYKYVVEPRAHGRAEPADRHEALGIPHRLPRVLAPRASPSCRCLPTRTTSSSTTRCSCRRMRSACGSARFRARRNISTMRARSISRRSVVYGLGVLRVSLQYALWRAGVARPHIFSAAEEWRLRPRGDAAASVVAG